MSVVRQLDPDSYQHHSRLSFFTADIAKPRLGLDCNLYELLASEFHEIIFNAWSTSWNIPLEDFEPLLCALRSAIHICTTGPRKPRLTFVSSTSALGNWSKLHPEQPLLPEEPAWDNASATRDGYGQSKQIAEQLIARAHEERQLRATIVRAGLIGGPSSTQPRSLSWPIQGSVYVLIKTSQRMGKWPAQINALDWIPVDALADGIAGITTTPSNNKVRVYNMMHPKPAPSILLYETLKSKFGLTAKLVSLPEWLENLNSTSKLRNFLQQAGMGREQEGMIFHNQNALGVLPSVEQITEQRLATWLDGWGLELERITSRL
ncbi:hypothetical protein ACJQWK_04765 [Exserohilum turcicum]